MLEKLKSLFAAVFIAMMLGLVVWAPDAAARNTIPSLGAGPYEIIMYSDYFCPPCNRIDAKAEPLLKELLATGKVKLTFVDVPFHKETPLYVRVYLYAANAGPTDEEVFRIRRVLFTAAQEKRIDDREALLAYVKEQKVTWRAFNEKPVFSMLSASIKQNKVDETPTCIIRYSPTEVEKYGGTDEIWDGLIKLKAYLAMMKR
ncbi:MAG: DsbA family protein [Deltaproteobacteria bacterium]